MEQNQGLKLDFATHISFRSRGSVYPQLQRAAAGMGRSCVFIFLLALQEGSLHRSSWEPGDLQYSNDLLKVPGMSQTHEVSFGSGSCQ